jgi:uncharacterized protein (DUF2062 family)
VSHSLSRLLHLHDTPRRTAAAFAIGVFFSFSPFVGLQIALSMALAFLLGLNRLAVFVGLNANLPWIIAPWYAGTTLAAAAVMGLTLPPDFRGQITSLFSFGIFSLDFWARAADVLRPLLIPFLVGPTVGAAAIGLAAYPVATVVLSRRSQTALSGREENRGSCSEHF